MDEENVLMGPSRPQEVTVSQAARRDGVSDAFLFLQHRSKNSSPGFSAVISVEKYVYDTSVRLKKIDFNKIQFTCYTTHMPYISAT